MQSVDGNVKGEVHFFEGAEKLLEIWFGAPSDGFSGSLRSIPQDCLDKLVSMARAQIIGQSSNAKLDGYVLSESSLFVSDRRLLLKTCGTTSILNAVQPAIRMASRYAGLQKVLSCNYSRRNFKRPELQPLAHQAFDEEVAFLESIFDGGAAYCMGKLNSDRWYLYNFTPDPFAIDFSDQTVEILMSDLNPDVMNIFTNNVSSSALQARKLSGIDKLMPHNSIMDDKLFDPCGYSLNALHNNKDEYSTIHITPEADFSYVSFETNLPLPSYVKLIEQVVETFKPRCFMVSLFSNELSILGHGGQHDLWYKTSLAHGQYGRNDLQVLSLPGGTVVCAQYTKKLNDDCLKPTVLM